MKLPAVLFKPLFVFLIACVFLPSHQLNSSSLPRVPNVAKIVNSIPLFQGKSVSVQVFPGGVSNSVLLVTVDENKKYILKIHLSENMKDFETILEYHARIQEAGIKIPATIIAPCVVDGFIVWVTEFIEGRHVANKDYDEVAKMMAQLHCIKIPESLVASEPDVQFFIDKCGSWKQCACLEKIWKTLDLQYIKDLPLGLIHGDFSNTNVLINDQKQVTLIDFDKMRIDYLLTDCVHALRWCAFDEEGNFKEDAYYSFIDAYQTVRPLTDVELTHIYTHLKHRLIRTAFLMYYHMYVKPNRTIEGLAGNPDLVERVLKNPENHHLDPERMVKKILLLEERGLDS